MYKKGKLRFIESFKRPHWIKMNETHFQINTRENRRCNQEWTIQRHLQCWTHLTIKTQDEDNQEWTIQRHCNVEHISQLRHRTKTIKNKNKTQYKQKIWETRIPPNTSFKAMVFKRVISQRICVIRYLRQFVSRQGVAPLQFRM